MRPSPKRTVITWALLIVWLVLISFGVVSALNPPWLAAISREGIEVEARTAKNAGDTLLRQRQYGRAIGLYRYALEIQPDYVGAMVNLAIAFGQVGEPERGEEILRRALQQGTGRTGVIAFNLAELLRRHGKTEEALTYYRQSLGSSVRQDRVYGRLGDLHLAAERYQDAREAFEMALGIQSDPAASYRKMLRRSLTSFEDDTVSLAVIEEQLGREWTAEDLEAYDLQVVLEAQKTDHEIARTHRCLGIVHGHLGDPVRAIEHLERALEIFPGDRDAANHLEMQRRLLEEREAADPDG